MSPSVHWPPRIYTYSFNVDGLTTIRPRTSYVKPSTSYTSQVEVPGDGPQFYDAARGPRRRTHRSVRGQIARRDNAADAGVHPSQYETGSQKYPVLYLLHGASDWDVAWTDVGRANIILDNLILDGKAKPMIVVMPSIFSRPRLARCDDSDAPRGAMSAAGAGARPGAAPTAAAAPAAAAGRGATPAPFRTMPSRGSCCRTSCRWCRRGTALSPDRTTRQSPDCPWAGRRPCEPGLAHIDVFHYVVGLSSAVGVGGGRRGAAPASDAAAAPPPDPTAAYPGLMANVAAANRTLKLFAMYCGTDDGLVYPGNKALSSALLAKGVNVKYTETTGGHWFIVWRRNLRDFAPLLFR